MNYKIEICPTQYKNGQLNGTVVVSIYDADVISFPLRKHEFAFEVRKTMLGFSGIDGDTLPPEMGKDSAGNDSELYQRIAVAVNAMYAGWEQSGMVMWHHTEPVFNG
jgi:hypothetical protein